MYGQVYFHDFGIILQFLLCGSAPCYGLLVTITTVFSMSAMKVEGAHLGVRIVPSLEPHHFQLPLLPVDEVSVLCLSGHGPNGEHYRYCKIKILFHSMAFHHNLIFLPSPKMWSFTFYRYFLKGKKSV